MQEEIEAAFERRFVEQKNGEMPSVWQQQKPPDGSIALLDLRQWPCHPEKKEAQK
jgi:hypothetical protein